MKNLGLKKNIIINDVDLLNNMKKMIFHDGDVRPVWVGGGFAKTEVKEFNNYANWANEHWSIYYSFIDDISNFDSKKILEAGCGSGFCSKNLSTFFKNSQIIAIDIDDLSIDFCKKYNFDDNIQYFSQDLITFNTDSKFDYIFLIETLEHIKHEYHNGIIKNLLNLLNNDGLIFICTPNEEDFSNTERGHVGILTSYYFNKFKEEFKNNIKSIKYIDNKNLLSNDKSLIINNSEGSHFRIILKK